MRKKVLIVVGTRPEVIKMVPVVQALQPYANELAVEICATGQQTVTLWQMLNGFGFCPDHELELMKLGQSLHEMTARCVMGMRSVYEGAKPDLVLVHGDTTTAFSAALAAFYSGIPVGHVEAGLRTFDINSPFPEELNRQMIARIAKLHFAPTVISRHQLWSEKVSGNLFQTGNTIVDAVHAILEKETPIETEQIVEWALEDPLILVTLHRRENWDQVENVAHAIERIVDGHPKAPCVVWSLHPNPTIAEALYKTINANCVVSGPSVGNDGRLLVTEPLPYGAFVHLLNKAAVVVTDSGGVLEEAATLGIPTVVLREKTERPEAIGEAPVYLAGTQPDRIVSAISEALLAQRKPTQAYGYGDAGVQIATIVREFLRS